ncbi:MAG: hypothetical protein E7812_05060 [Phenylobacterium sp.]|nr:MAG: hypothetical protein E7812_05060 [Phenylobacterium sp.]
MNLKRTALVAVLGALAAGATVSAASAQPLDPGHPRQSEVLARAAHQRAEIRRDERTGRISHAKAHRLLVADRRVAMRDHRLSRHNGGYISRAEQHRLNQRENQLGGRIPG